MIDVYILGHAITLQHGVNNRCSFMKGPPLSLTIHCEPVFRRGPTYLPCCLQGVVDSCGYDQGHSSTSPKKSSWDSAPQEIPNLATPKIGVFLVVVRKSTFKMHSWLGTMIYI